MLENISSDVHPNPRLRNCRHARYHQTTPTSPRNVPIKDVVRYNHVHGFLHSSATKNECENCATMRTHQKAASNGPRLHRRQPSVKGGRDDMECTDSIKIWKHEIEYASCHSI
jgi:hypothetical protein